MGMAIQNNMDNRTFIDIVSIPYGNGNTKCRKNHSSARSRRKVSIPYGNGNTKKRELGVYDIKSFNSLWEWQYTVACVLNSVRQVSIPYGNGNIANGMLIISKRVSIPYGNGNAAAEPQTDKLYCKRVSIPYGNGNTNGKHRHPAFTPCFNSLWEWQYNKHLLVLWLYHTRYCVVNFLPQICTIKKQG